MKRKRGFRGVAKNTDGNVYIPTNNINLYEVNGIYFLEDAEFAGSVFTFINKRVKSDTSNGQMQHKVDKAFSDFERELMPKSIRDEVIGLYPGDESSNLVQEFLVGGWFINSTPSLFKNICGYSVRWDFSLALSVATFCSDKGFLHKIDRRQKTGFLELQDLFAEQFQLSWRRRTQRRNQRYEDTEI